MLKLFVKVVGGMSSSIFPIFFYSQKKKNHNNSYNILIKDSIRQRIIDYIVIILGVYMTMATKVSFMHSSLIVADLRCLVYMLLQCFRFLLCACYDSMTTYTFASLVGTQLLQFFFFFEELNYRIERTNSYIPDKHVDTYLI